MVHTRRLSPALLAVVALMACAPAPDQPDYVLADDTGKDTASLAGAGPNLLVIVADDLGADKVGIYADDFPGYADAAEHLPVTPHIDTLATTGLRFSTAWANPTCSPTRSALETGRYAFRTGVGTTVPLGPGLSTDEFSIADALSHAGYDTALFGKWHLGTDGVGGDPDWNLSDTETSREVDDGANPMIFGWGRFDGSLPGQVEDYHRWIRVVSASTRASTISWESGYATDVTTEAALEWIARRERPWLAYVNYNAPHASGENMVPEVDDLDADCPGTSHGDDPAAIFAELVQCLDDRVGRLVDGIPTDTLENTLIVFLGDNGTEAQLVEGPFVPSADRPYGKGSTYETGVRVPLVVVSGHRLIEWRACLDAGVLDGGTGECPTTDTRIAEPGRVVHEPVAAVDLPATLAELAGAAMSPAVDSVSFADCLTDPDCTRDRPLWSETFQVDDDGALTMGNGGYREGDDKLVLAWDAERACLAAELYDLDADPYETTDRAAQAPDLVTTLVGGVHGLGVAWLDGKPLCDGDTSL